MKELETLPRLEARAPAKGGRLTKGALLILVWCALLHAFNVFVSLNMVTTTNVIYQRLYEPSEYGYLAAAVSQSVGYLLYPLAGLLAELRWTRYRTMMCGTVLIATGSIVLIPATLLFPNKWTVDPDEVIAQSELSAGPMTVGLLLFQSGMAMFEANAIQFGLDQLAFESTVTLGSFIHWYYWSANFYLVPSVAEVGGPLWIQAAAQIALAAVSLALVFLCRGHMNKEPPRQINPIRLVYACLSFARTHRALVSRSAFTYGNETLPSRLDLAKSRYGGPFSTEQVEDVKSFGRILAIMLSAFGFLLLNTFNYTPEKFERLRYPNRYGSVDWYVFLQSVACVAVAIVYIPFYQLVVVRHFPSLVPSLFKRLGIGLVVCVASLAINTALSCYTYVRTVASYPDCSTYFIGLNSTPRTYIFEEGGFVLYFHTASQLLDGLAYVLVFLTMLEFIVAQSPIIMQGFLIGLWYAMQAFGVMLNVVFLTTYVVGGCQYWPDVAKTTLAAVSLATFFAASGCYKFRQREEVSYLNEQSVIEEYYERQLYAKTQSRLTTQCTEKAKNTSGLESLQVSLLEHKN